MNLLEKKNIVFKLIKTFNEASRESIDLYNIGLKVFIKDDNSPVTNSDLKVNKILSKKI